MSRRTKKALPGIEALDSRMMLSGAAGAMPVVAAQVGALETSPEPLNGTVRGIYSAHRAPPDVGTPYTFSGSGRVTPLGQVKSHGSLHGTGFIAQGTASGTFTLSTRRGTITLQLTGPTQAGFSGLPTHFDYTIVGGSGRLEFASDHGTAILVRTAAKGGNGPEHGKFTLTLASSAGLGSG